jgi:hypothetical protein
MSGAAQRREWWLDIIKVVYGGVPGGMPEGDTEQLRAIAAWLDSIDDAADVALDGRAVLDRAHSLQGSLRRIADDLDARTANRDCDHCGDPVYCASCAAEERDGDAA